MKKNTQNDIFIQTSSYDALYYLLLYGTMDLYESKYMRKINELYQSEEFEVNLKDNNINIF